MLTKVPGIGKKTAQRLVLELREKIKGKTEIGDSSAVFAGSGVQSEALETMLALGFSLEEGKKALAQINTKDRELTVEEQVKEALRFIALQK